MRAGWISYFTLIFVLALATAPMASFAQDESDEELEDDSFIPDYSDFAPPDMPPPPPPPPPAGRIEEPTPPPSYETGGESDSRPVYVGPDRTTERGVRFYLVREGEEGRKRRPWPSRKRKVKDSEY